MHRLTTCLLAFILTVATFAIAWSSASAGPAAHGAMASAHQAVEGAAHHAHAPLAVHGVHPDGPEAKDCAAMAFGCIGLVAQASLVPQVPVPPARGERTAFRGLPGDGLPPSPPETRPKG